MRTVRRRLFVGLAIVAGALGFVYGCGESERPSAAGLNGAASCTEGARMACHATLGTRAHSTDCFVGEQICSGGSWSTCGVAGASIQTVLRASRSGAMGIVPTSLGVAMTDAGNCTDDPCNPNCIGFTETPTSSLAPAVNASTVSGAANYTASSLLGAVLNVPDTLTDCGLGHDLVGGAGLTGIACNYDECCSDALPMATTYGGGTCKRYDDPAATGALCNPSACGLPDFTAAPGCTRAADGTIHLALCNRGDAGATTGDLQVGIGPATLLGFLGGDPCATAPVLGGTDGHCTIDLSRTPIPSDECIDINFGTAMTVNGVVQPGVTCSNVDLTTSSVVYVNSGFTASPRLAECAGAPACNNASELRPADACALYGTGSVTEVVDYTATCPAGFRSVWKYLSYQGNPGTVPDGGRVQFFARPYAVATDGGSSPLADVSLVDLGPGSEATCAYSSPRAAGSDGGVCPVDVGAEIDAANPTDLPSASPSLTLGIVLRGSAPLVPSIESWKLDYDCIPKE